MARLLDSEHIERLLHQVNKREVTKSVNKHKRQLTEEQAVLLLKAAQKHADRVTLGKRMFGIKYRTDADGEPAVYIWPLDGTFVLCGEYTIAKLVVFDEGT